MPKYEVTSYWIETSYERYVVTVEADNPQDAIDRIAKGEDWLDFMHSKNIDVLKQEPVDVEEWEAEES